MASKYYIGIAPLIAQVATITPAGTITTGDVNTLTVTDELGATIATISFTVGGTTTAAAIVTGLTAAWNANPITVALATPSGTGTFILTAVSAGVPFYVASAVTGVGTLTTVATTANSGPSVISMPINWSNGVAPANSDKITFDSRMLAAALYGLNQSSITPAEVHYDLGCGVIGQQNIPLTWAGVTVWDAGRNPANIQPTQGSGRINVNHGTGAGVGIVYGTNPQPLDSGMETLRLKATNASNSISINGGLVGIATSLPADTATIQTIGVNGGIVNISSGVTTTTVTNNGGTVTQYCPSTTSANYNAQGSLTIAGTVLVGTVNAAAGKVFLKNRPASGAAVTTLNQTGATVDTTGNTAPLTISQWNFSAGELDQIGTSQVTFSAQAIVGWILGKFKGAMS